MDDRQWSELERAAEALRPVAASESLFDLWFSPRGRISRRSYWLKFLLPLTGLSLVTGVAQVLLTWTAPMAAVALGGLTTLALTWPGAVGFVKRLHDLDHSGWLAGGCYGGCMLAGLLPLLGVGGFALLGPPVVLAVVLTFWYGLKACYFRGVPGPNRFGPAPID